MNFPPMDHLTTEEGDNQQPVYTRAKQPAHGAAPPAVSPMTGNRRKHITSLDDIITIPRLQDEIRALSTLDRPWLSIECMDGPYFRVHLLIELPPTMKLIQS